MTGKCKDAMAYMRLVVNPMMICRSSASSMSQSAESAPRPGKRSGRWGVRGRNVLRALADPDSEVLGTLPGKAYDKVKAMTECLTLCRQERRI